MIFEGKPWSTPAIPQPSPHLPGHVVAAGPLRISQWLGLCGDVHRVSFSHSFSAKGTATGKFPTNNLPDYSCITLWSDLSEVISLSLSLLQDVHSGLHQVQRAGPWAHRPMTIHTMLGWSGHHPWDTRTENLCPMSHLDQTTKLGSPTALQTGGNQNRHNQPQPCPSSTILNQQTFPPSHTHPAPRRQISSMELQAPLRSKGSQKRWALVADHWSWWWKLM